MGPADFENAIEFARCMRANGVTNLLDPEQVGNGIGFQLGEPGDANDPLSPDSPVMQAAEKACAALPEGGAGTDKGGRRSTQTPSTPYRRSPPSSREVAGRRRSCFPLGQRFGVLASLHVVSSANYASDVDPEHDPTAGHAARLAGCEAASTKVYRALIAMGTPRADAEDALQDALEAAVRTSAHVGRADGWLFVVALQRWRGHRWRQRIFRPLAAVGSSARSDRDGEIDLLVELTRLPERQRAVLVARHVLGLSQNETAIALGMAPGTVGSIGHRAIKELRRRLGE